MSPEVARAIQACLAAAPGFEYLRDDVEALGFFETMRHEGDVRWTNAEGNDVFLSYLPSQTACSVWFDGEYEAEVSELSKLLAAHGHSSALRTDQHGAVWAIGDKRNMRLVVKEETGRGLEARLRLRSENLRLAAKKPVKQRLGATLLVQRD